MRNRYVLPNFGDMALANLRRFDLQTHLNALAKKYSQSVVHKARTWVRATLEEAVEQEFLAKNPARKLTMPPRRDTCKRYLTKAEYQRLLEELRGRDRLILRLFVICAFRPGELFALRWRCFADGCLRVEEAVYQGKIGTPKTKGSAAEVVLPRSLAEELAQWYEESDCPDPDAFIFPSSKNKPIDGHNYLRRDVLRPAAERVGIRVVKFQSLRRTFATHFHRIGTVKDHQAQMRHKTAQVTMNVYTQSMSDSVRAAMEEFDREMSKSAAPKTLKDSEHK